MSFWPARGKLLTAKGATIAKKTLKTEFAKNQKAETAAVVAAAVSPLFEI